MRCVTCDGSGRIWGGLNAPTEPCPACSEGFAEKSAEDDRKSFGVMGVSRMFDNDRAVLISTRRRLTDDQLRELHEWLR